jgi:hypothetical protein
VWADTAYGLTPWCIVPYKAPLSLVPENRQFNYYLSHVCENFNHLNCYLSIMSMITGPHPV